MRIEFVTLGLSLMLIVAVNAHGAESPPRTPDPASKPVEPKSANPAVPQSGTQAVAPEPFVPTDKISSDSVISFPADI